MWLPIYEIGIYNNDAGTVYIRVWGLFSHKCLESHAPNFQALPLVSDTLNKKLDMMFYMLPNYIIFHEIFVF